MNIETKQFVMRSVEPEDAKFLADLLNDQEVRDSLGAYNLVFPTSVELEEKWIADAIKRSDQAVMILTKRATGKPLGLVVLSDMNLRNASAHLSIILERKSWDKGYGTEAVSGVLIHLFGKMNMHRVWLRVDQRNARAIRCYEKCGFRMDGTLREDHFANGSWRSSYVMSILSSDNRGVKD